MAVAGHKFYGPRIGALWARNPAELAPLFGGGGQENGLRPGTENTAMIVGLGKAAEIAKTELLKNSRNMKATRDLLYKQICSIPGVKWLSGTFNDLLFYKYFSFRKFNL